MIKIGLSGNRFSGKSEVSKLFDKISIPVFDADLVIRFILAHEFGIMAQIRDKVGHKYFKSGHLDPVSIERDGVFNEVLNIVEPILFKAYYKFENDNKNSVYTIFKSSLLFDRGWYKKMDYNISVYSPFIHRVERAKKSKETGLNNITNINMILNKESDELNKNSLSDYVIHNYNEFNLKKQVNDIDQKIIDLYLKKEYNKELS